MSLNLFNYDLIPDRDILYELGVNINFDKNYFFTIKLNLYETTKLNGQRTLWNQRELPSQKCTKRKNKFEIDNIKKLTIIQ